MNYFLKLVLNWPSASSALTEPSASCLPPFIGRNCYVTQARYAGSDIGRSSRGGSPILRSHVLETAVALLSLTS